MEMNDHKICFIICANKENYLKECEWYIEQLILPDGYEKEVIAIRDAVSMTSGYNRAMKSSDAKYKIYMHQDVFIFNPNMICELLEMFQDPSIGMVGVVGIKEFMPSAEYHNNWDLANLASVITSDGITPVEWKIPGQCGELIEVTGIDGMFMATQYDLPWEEDFDGWHFYDMSQCVNFVNAGYRLVVPCQEEVWMCHDCGYTSYKNYDRYRRIFCEKYASLGYNYTSSDLEEQEEEWEEVRQQAVSAAENKNRQEFELLVKQLGEEGSEDTRLVYASSLLGIYKAETETYGKSQLAGNISLQEFIPFYDKVKFLLRRIEYGKPLEDCEELRDMLVSGKVTEAMIAHVINATVDKRIYVWQRMTVWFREELSLLLLQGEVVEIEKRLKKIRYWGKDLAVLYILLHIFRLEVEKESSTTVFDYSLELDELVDHFIKLKLYMRRLEFDLPKEKQREIYDFCVKTGVSDHLILYILKNNIFFKENFCKNMAAILAEAEGEHSMRARLYSEMAGSV